MVAGGRWEVGERFKREEIYVCLWLVHGDVWQKPTEYYKAIILQFKKNLKVEKKNILGERGKQQ